jgi:urease subunit alpha
MPHNAGRPQIRVEPDTFRVWIDGEEIAPAPAEELPLAQRYELF